MCIVSSWCYACGCPAAFKPHDNPIQRCQKWLDAEPGSNSPPCQTKRHFDFLQSRCVKGCYPPRRPFRDNVIWPKGVLGGDVQAAKPDANPKSLREDTADDDDSAIDMEFDEKRTGERKKR